MTTAGWSAIVVSSARFGSETPLAEWQLARALAERRPTLFVEPPRFVHERGPVERGWRPRARAERLWSVRPLTSPGADRAALGPAAERCIGRQIETAARRVLGGARVIVSMEPRRGMLRTVHRHAFVYCQRDDVGAADGVRHRHELVRRHLRVLGSADVVTAVSPALVAAAEQAGRTAHLLPNGCDVDHFARAQPRPDPLEDRGRPIVGYAGGISWRLDVDLIAALCRRRPDVDVMLVGDVERRLPDLPNLRCAGRVGYGDLPGWLQRFEVGLVPYVADDFNGASFPLKVFEYLAAGAPVVASDLPALRGFDPHVRVTVDEGEFVAAVGDALATGPSSASCRSLAASNSWRTRADELAALVDAHLATLGPS